MKKVLFALFLSLGMIITFSYCNNGEEEPTDDGKSQPVDSVAVKDTTVADEKH